MVITDKNIYHRAVEIIYTIFHIEKQTLVILFGLSHQEGKCGEAESIWKIFMCSSVRVTSETLICVTLVGSMACKYTNSRRLHDCVLIRHLRKRIYDRRDSRVKLTFITHINTQHDHSPPPLSDDIASQCCQQWTKNVCGWIIKSL